MSLNDLTPDDMAILEAAQVRMRERAAVAVGIEIQQPSPIASLVEPASPCEGLPPSVLECTGGCGKPQKKRGVWCDECGNAHAKSIRAAHLAEARASLSPEGATDLLRAGTKPYRAAVRGGLAAGKDGFARRIIGSAGWQRADGNVLILGDTSMGKTSCAVAIGHRILDQAEAGKVDATGFAFASKLRFVSAIDLARARSDRARSDAEPRIIREAKCASLLILDEIAYEATKFDPQVVRDVIYERYRYGAKRPMIVTSGARMAELHERYGEAMIRRITDMGSVIDLW